jgi:hypothetical protein
MTALVSIASQLKAISLTSEPWPLLLAMHQPAISLTFADQKVVYELANTNTTERKTLRSKSSIVRIGKEYSSTQFHYDTKHGL